MSVKIPIWAAWYLDLSNRSISSSFLFGDSFPSFTTLASGWTSPVACFRWSLKPIMGLICATSIMYDVFGGRCLMCVPSSDFIVLIRHLRRLVCA